MNDQQRHPSFIETADPGPNAATGPAGAGPAGAGPAEALTYPVFEAVLYPRRSLSPRGFVILITVTGIVGFAYGIAFLLMGAWPIFGFCGTEWLLFIYLFRKHLKGDRRAERLRLYDDRFTVETISPRGEVQRYRFQPYWLQVILDRPDEPDNALYLRSHGKQLQIGAFLSPQERRDIAGELRHALTRWRAA
jgi:uncharacterized membrane protein